LVFIFLVEEESTRRRPMNMSARHVITRRSAGHIYLPAIGGATGQEPWTPWRRARPKQQPPARSGGSKLFGRLDSHNYDRALVYKWAKRGDTYAEIGEFAAWIASLVQWRSELLRLRVKILKSYFYEAPKCALS